MAAATLNPMPQDEDEVFDPTRVPKRKSTLHRESEMAMEAESPTRLHPALASPPSAAVVKTLPSPRSKRAILYTKNESDCKPNAPRLCEARQTVAVASLGEFERRLLQAKRGKRQPPPSVCQIPWYHQTISRHVAESLLLLPTVSNGTYLLRDSSSQSESYTLSVRCKTSVKHYKVLWDGKQFCFGLGKFPTINDLLEHFDNQPIICGDSGILVQMLYPYPRGIAEPAIYDSTTVHIENSDAPQHIKNGSSVSSTTSDLSISSKEGYLTKLGQHRKNWKRRWFVLYRRELKYFKTHEEPTPLRVISLDDVLAVDRDETAGRPFCVRVMTSYRTFFLCASSEADASEWKRILEWKLSNNTPGTPSDS